MLNMIEEINIDEFRGIEGLNIQNLSRINILVGNNNSGKTSVLEAIALLANPADVGTVVKMITSRVDNSYKSNLIDVLRAAFRKENDNLIIHLGGFINECNIDLLVKGKIKVMIDISESEESKRNDDTVFDLQLEVQKDGRTFKAAGEKIGTSRQIEVKHDSELYKSIFMPATTSLYKSCLMHYPEVIKLGKKGTFIKILQVFDKGIKDITVINDMIWVSHSKKETMPLFSYGSGVQKALLMGILLVLAQDGILLIDEIETAIHSKALKEVFEFIIKASKKLNVQMFVTTHSIEAVDKLLDAAGYDTTSNVLNNDMIRIITLRKDDLSERTSAMVLTGREAFYKRDTYEMELRI